MVASLSQLRHLILKWQTLVLAFLAIVVITWTIVHFNEKQPHLVDTRGMNIHDKSNVHVYPVTLFGMPSISRIKGHAHSPFGIHGKNHYQFDGIVEVNRIRCNLHIVDHEPLAAVGLNSGIFIVAQGYFDENKENFVIYRLDSKRVFRHATINQLPKEFWSLRFADDDQTCFYRVWLLDSLASQVSSAEAIECFRFLSKLNPRFGFINNWNATPGTLGEDISSFVKDVIVTNNARNVVPILIEMLRAIERTDDPEMITDLCYGLYELDPIRASEAICEFKQRIPVITDRSDMRAIMFLDWPFFQQLVCQPGNSKESG